MSEQIAGNETRQIRFAVVMYGGGSLAIYINGIAQELLKMVRTTADKRSPSDDFTEPEKVYRRIALLLSDEELLEQISGLTDERQIKLALEALLNKNREELKIEHPRLFKEVIEDRRRRIAPVPKEERDTIDIENIIEKALRLNQPQVRFIVDVISGSSAGGINGVFLAKALVNNQKIDDLKQLWLREGAFEKLLNDKKSIAGTNLENSTQPQSLLNSRRMYLRLLEALDGMDRAKTAEDESPNVEELDLYVTVTDYTGVPIAIRLFDRIVRERRHKQFFHFKYEKDNKAPRQFSKDYNPFLAFAARCTSAFPLAFEPMRLSDIDEVIERCKPEYRNRKSDAPEWKQFFEPFNLRKTDTPETRYFLDGGALDNKPFGFALETLLERQSDVPVDRKLIYIEPSPEFINQEGDILKKPDAVENLIAQGSTLPRYETIREDLQALLDRNRFVVRVNKLIRNTEKTIFESYNDPKILEKLYSRKRRPDNAAPQGNAPGEKWENYGFTDIVASKGRCFLPYYQLRLISLTDNLARPITRFFGFSDKSDYFLAIRSLINYWREKEFVADRKTEEDKTFNYFLRHYDFSYRLRRLRFVLRKVEQMTLFPEELQKQLESVWKKEVEGYNPTEIDSKLQGAIEEFNRKEKIQVKMLDGTRRFLYPGAVIWDFYLENPEAKEKISIYSGEIQKSLKTIYDKLKSDLERLNTFKLSSVKSPDEEMNESERSLFQALRGVKIKSEYLDFILGKVNPRGEEIYVDFNEDVGDQRAKEFFEKIKGGKEAYDSLKSAGEQLDDFLMPIFKKAGEDIDRVLEPDEKAKENADLKTALQAYFFYYYDNFDDYDQISFPIYFQTNIGEADTVDIIRISPHDAKGLIDEEDGSDGRRKLAGGALFGFGAFLDVAWRQNDIMWGRLDGAERLITALLPTGTEYYLLRKVLIEEAHSIILKEEFLKHNTENLAALYSEVLLKTSAGIEAEEAIRQAVSPINNKANGDLRPVINACLKDPKIRAVLAEHLSAKWEKRGKVPTAAIEGALDSAEVHKALYKYFESNASTGAVAAITHQTSSQKPAPKRADLLK